MANIENQWGYGGIRVNVIASGFLFFRECHIFNFAFSLSLLGWSLLYAVFARIAYGVFRTAFVIYWRSYNIKVM
ncbi:MAG: hypothetical protein LBM19_03640 [Holosporales bacterium]|jgi:hypothetical protein|nr:hypothetical protein [Holosporales bacterium]